MSLTFDFSASPQGITHSLAYYSTFSNLGIPNREDQPIEGISALTVDISWLNTDGERESTTRTLSAIESRFYNNPATFQYFPGGGYWYKITEDLSYAFKIYSQSSVPEVPLITDYLQNSYSANTRDAVEAEIRADFQRWIDARNTWEDTLGNTPVSKIEMFNGPRLLGTITSDQPVPSRSFLDQLPALLNQGNTVRGGSGPDTIEELAGIDTVFGGEGSDRITGGLDNDILDGGPGSDTAIFQGEGSSYVVYLENFLPVDGGVYRWTVQGPDGTDSVVLFENYSFDNVTLTNDQLYNQLINAEKLPPLVRLYDQEVRRAFRVDELISSVETMKSALADVSSAADLALFTQTIASGFNVMTIIVGSVIGGTQGIVAGFAAAFANAGATIIGQTLAGEREIKYSELAYDNFGLAIGLLESVYGIAYDLLRTAAKAVGGDADSIRVLFNEAERLNIELALFEDDLKSLRDAGSQIDARIEELEKALRDHFQLSEGLPKVRVADDSPETPSPQYKMPSAPSYQTADGSKLVVGEGTLTGGPSDDVLIGGSGSDSLAGGSGDDIVFGGGGNDTIIGGSGEGDDWYDGGDGEDVIIFSSTSLGVTVDLQAGIASGAEIGADNILNVEHVVAGRGNDRIVGDDNNNRIEGAEGDDNIDGGAGMDTALYRGASNGYAIVRNEDGTVTIVDIDLSDGDEGLDTLVNVELALFAGDDTVVTLDPTPETPAIISGVRTGAVTEDATLTATGQLTITDPDEGEARFQAGTKTGAYGSLVLSETGGWTYALNNASLAVQALNSGQSLTDTIAIQSADGTDSAIVITINGADEPSAGGITGTNRGETLKGTKGADIITPLGGKDTVKAGKGNDVIKATVNDGNDRYDGEGGSDTVDYSALTKSIDVHLNKHSCPGTAKGKQSGTDTLISIENVIGSQAGDKIVGSKAANLIEGGAGDDKLTGGGGADTFVFKPGFGNDRITDFDANPSGGQDLIDLTAFGITSAAEFAERVAITDIGAHTLVTIDADAAQTIRLDGIGNATTVTVDDFRFL